MTTPNLNLSYLTSNQINKESTFNYNFELIDALTLPLFGAYSSSSVFQNTFNPLTPTSRCFLVGSSPTGVLSGFTNHIAVNLATGLVFISPKGTFFDSEGITLFWDGTAWVNVALPVGGVLQFIEYPTLDINNVTGIASATSFTYTMATTVTISGMIDTYVYQFVPNGQVVTLDTTGLTYYGVSSSSTVPLRVLKQNGIYYGSNF